MFATFKTAALSALIAVGTLAAIPAQAQSNSIYLGFGSGHAGPSVGFHFNDRGVHTVRDRHRPSYRAGRCGPRQAISKASRMGLRHARIIHENRRVVRVEGRTHGRHFARVTFANERGCPVIR